MARAGDGARRCLVGPPAITQVNGVCPRTWSGCRHVRLRLSRPEGLTLCNATGCLTNMYPMICIPSGRSIGHPGVMKTLVTGGAGFIGAHVARHRIAAGDEVVVLDDLSGGDRANVPEGATLVVADVADPAAVTEVFDHWPFDHVFHLAAYAARACLISSGVSTTPVTSSDRST
jgi:hypothetical protein